MKLIYLKEIIDGIIERHPRNIDEIEVKVLTNENSIGARASSDVRSASLGFDFETGKFLIATKDKLYKEPQTTPIDKIAVIFEGNKVQAYTCPICGSFVEKDDHFCRCCGKKFNELNQKN